MIPYPNPLPSTPPLPCSPPPVSHHHLQIVIFTLAEHIYFLPTSFSLLLLSIFLLQTEPLPCHHSILLPLLVSACLTPHPFLHCLQHLSVHSPPPPPPSSTPLPGSILGNFLLLLNWDGGWMEGKIKGWADERRLGMSANGAGGGFTHHKYAVHPPLLFLFSVPLAPFLSGVKVPMPFSLLLSHYPLSLLLSPL